MRLRTLAFLLVSAAFAATVQAQAIPPQEGLGVSPTASEPTAPTVKQIGMSGRRGDQSPKTNDAFPSGSPAGMQATPQRPLPPAPYAIPPATTAKKKELRSDKALLSKKPTEEDPAVVTRTQPTTTTNKSNKNTGINGFVPYSPATTTTTTGNVITQ